MGGRQLITTPRLLRLPEPTAMPCWVRLSHPLKVNIAALHICADQLHPELLTDVHIFKPQNLILKGDKAIACLPYTFPEVWGLIFGHQGSTGCFAWFGSTTNMKFFLKNSVIV
jgi:hypothetical protein